MMENFENEIRNDERIKCAVNGLLEGLSEQVVRKINLLTDEQMLQVKKLFKEVKFEEKDERGRIIINDPSEIPIGMTEDETVKFWETHAMSENMLENTFISETMKDLWDNKEDDIYNDSGLTVKEYGESVWASVLESLERRISKPSFQTWIKPTTIQIEDDVIFVESENEFSRDWLEARYKTIIFETVREVIGRTFDIEFISKTTPHRHEYSLQTKIGSSEYEELKGLINKQNEKIEELHEKLQHGALKVNDDGKWAEEINKHKVEYDDYWRISYAIKKYDRKIIIKMLQKGEFTDEQIRKLFEITDFELNQIKDFLNARAGRNIKINVSDDISHTGLSDEEYRMLEEHIEDAELSKKFDNRLDLPEEK